MITRDSNINKTLCTQLCARGRVRFRTSCRRVAIDVRVDANNRIYRLAKIIIKPPSNWEYHTFPGKHCAERATVRVM